MIRLLYSTLCYAKQNCRSKMHLVQHFSKALIPLYRRTAVLGLPARDLPCNTNTNGEYGGWRSSSKPAFWMAASAWADVWSGALSWLQVTSIFPKRKEFMKEHKLSDDEYVICTANGWLEEHQFFYNGIRALEKWYIFNRRLSARSWRLEVR